jgi:hypothetical protein
MVSERERRIEGLSKKKLLRKTDILFLVQDNGWKTDYVITDDWIALRDNEGGTGSARKPLLEEVPKPEALMNEVEISIVEDSIRYACLFLPCKPDIFFLWTKLNTNLTPHPIFIRSMAERFPMLASMEEWEQEEWYLAGNRPVSDGTPKPAELPTNPRHPYSSTNRTRPKFKFEIYFDELCERFERLPDTAEVIKTLIDDTMSNDGPFEDYHSGSRTFETLDGTLATKTIQNWCSELRRERKG